MLLKYKRWLADYSPWPGSEKMLLFNYQTNFVLHQVEIGQEELLDCTEDIMEAIDVDGDGDITQVELQII